jgi:hypothetical protein
MARGNLTVVTGESEDPDTIGKVLYVQGFQVRGVGGPEWAAAANGRRGVFASMGTGNPARGAGAGPPAASAPAPNARAPAPAAPRRPAPRTRPR